MDVQQQTVKSQAEDMGRISASLEEYKSKITHLDSELSDAKKKLLQSTTVANAVPVMAATQKIVKGKVCYLTFDDGPSDNTLKILDTLKKYNVPATFFVTGTGKTEYIKKIYDAGHSIGLHSYSHNYAAIYKNKQPLFST